jgi:hypothetical protein
MPYDQQRLELDEKWRLSDLQRLQLDKQRRQIEAERAANQK